MTFEMNGTTPQCNWIVQAPTLVPGLGSNANVSLYPRSTLSRQDYYKQIESLTPLQFKSETIDGIPAVVGFGANNEVQVDVGPTVVIVAALSTVSSSRNSAAAQEIATNAVGNLCHWISCQN